MDAETRKADARLQAFIRGVQTCRSCAGCAYEDMANNHPEQCGNVEFTSEYFSH